MVITSASVCEFVSEGVPSSVTPSAEAFDDFLAVSPSIVRMVCLVLVWNWTVQPEK